MSPPPAPRPGAFCETLLLALAASDGRRRRRKRDTTPDAIGMAMKRALLERAARQDPDPADFEGFLLAACLEAGGDGGLRAMALEILEEYRLCEAEPAFRGWLEQGAPSDDALGQ